MTTNQMSFQWHNKLIMCTLNKTYLFISKTFLEKWEMHIFLARIYNYILIKLLFKYSPKRGLCFYEIDFITYNYMKKIGWVMHKKHARRRLFSKGVCNWIRGFDFTTCFLYHQMDSRIVKSLFFLLFNEKKN